METNKFGYRMGTGAQLLSEAIDGTPRTAEEISQRAGNPRGAAREHLDGMVKFGQAEKAEIDGRVKYWIPVSAPAPLL